MTPEDTKSILEIINAIGTTITSCLAAWIVWKQLELKTKIDANLTEIQLNTLELKRNTYQTREVKHEARNMAHTALLATKVVAIKAEETDKRLEKIDTNTEIVKRLANGDKTKLMREKAEIARTLADSTQNPQHVLIADEAEVAWKKHQEHVDCAEEKVIEEKAKEP